MEQILIRDKRILINRIKEYISIIRNEFPDLVQIPGDIDYEKLVHIENTGTVSLFVRDSNFYFPASAYEMFKKLNSHPNFGINKEHKTYTLDTLISNNNDFYDYIEHLILIGAEPIEYFEEVLLHEVMHFCGSNGASALTEGINEYLTRKIALKYNIITNGCGYPKEIKIVLKLKEILGEETLIKLAFCKNLMELKTILKHPEQIEFLSELSKLMDREFHLKYYQYQFKTPFEKAERYKDIDYQEAHDLIDTYMTNHKIKR